MKKKQYVVIEPLSSKPDPMFNKIADAIAEANKRGNGSYVMTFEWDKDQMKAKGNVVYSTER